MLGEVYCSLAVFTALSVALITASAAWRGHLDTTRAGVGLGRSAMLGRWGGEEFVLLLLGHDLSHAVALVDSLRKVTPAGQTFSAGVALSDGLETPKEVFARADAALYAAKAAGRDQVLAAEHGREEPTLITEDEPATTS